jgi:RNA polymerase sigma factor (sigma-70 family)
MRPALSDPALLGAVEAMVRRRVPAADVDDVVQSALADAVASEDAPEDPEALRRWLSGVVRHKVADFHRRRRREAPARSDAIEGATGTAGMADLDPRGEAAAHEERDLLRWATRQLPAEGDAQKTLEWMMHEAEGEKLEAIAERERIPATRVRQRVSRMRAFFRDRWRAELAMVAAALTIAVLAWVAWHGAKSPPIARDPTPSVDRRAERMRDRARDACAKSEWRACVDGLDEARAIDPAGDAAPDVQSLRAAAAEALAPPRPRLPPTDPTAPLAPPPAPTTSAAPAPKPGPRVAPTAAPQPLPPPISAPARSATPKPTAPRSTEPSRPSGSSL